jgi:hypothetical protein
MKRERKNKKNEVRKNGRKEEIRNIRTEIMKETKYCRRQPSSYSPP